MITFKLSWDLILWAILAGVVLSIIYLSLLWQSVKMLPKVKHKVLFHFGSAAIRLAIFIFISILFVQNHPAQLLWMFMAFVITRFIIVNWVKNKIRGQNG